MQLTDTFTVAASPDRLWEVLTDVERIAPCVPGFELAEVSDPNYRGRMKIKVGAINMQYDATITFVERDDAARRAVLKVVGKERRGPGSVDATVTASLAGEGEQTKAEMSTDVQVTGRVAQFGRGIITDVSSRLTERFVENLDKQVLNPPTSAAQNGDVPKIAGGAPEEEKKEEVKPLDLGALSAVPVLKRALPVVVVAAILLLLIRRKRGSR